MLGIYAAMMLALLELEAWWLGVLAKPLDQQAIGHLIQPSP
jgi:hypothetical protein